MINKASIYSKVFNHPEKLIILRECECDKPKIKHHPDYNKPFEIELLCKSCHWKEHKRLNPEFSKIKKKRKYLPKDFIPQLSIRMDEELIKKIDAQAEKEDRSRSNMISQLCLRALEKEEEKP